MKKSNNYPLHRLSSFIVISVIRYCTTKAYRKTVTLALELGIEALEKLEVERAKGNYGPVSIQLDFNARPTSDKKEQLR